MKRLLLAFVVLAAALSVMPMGASAQNIPGLKIAFNDCGGPAEFTWTCDVNTGIAFTAVASAVIDASSPLEHVTGEETTIEIAFQTPVPEWWKSGTGFCRAGTAVSVAYNGGSFSCIDYFGSVSATVGSNSYQIGPDAGVGDPNGPIDANRVRIRALSAVDYNLAIVTPPPNVGDEVFLFNITVSKSKSTGAGFCDGCTAQSCIMLKHAKLTQPAGVGDPVYDLPAAGTTPVITGNPTGTADCVTVPTRSHTWGQIKSLYR